jgi:hypothetical protein
VKVSNEGILESREGIYILKSEGREFELKLDSNALVSAEAMKKAFMNRAMVNSKISSLNITALVDFILKQKSLEIREIPHAGFDKKTESFIFDDFAITKLGKVIYKNESGFIPEINVFPFNYKSGVKIIGEADYRGYWELLYRAWGEKGLLFAGFYVATYLRDFILDSLGFFPFLSGHGDAQTGKTNLVRTQNNAYAFDTKDGQSVGGASTLKGILRALAQRSHIPAVILEANEGEKIKLDENQLLTIFDGLPLQTRAAFSNDNTTKVMECKTSLIFIQNKEFFQMEATKQRVISYEFALEDLTEESKKAFIQLRDLAMENKLSGIGKMTIEKLMEIKEKVISCVRDYSEQIHKEVGHDRISDTHALPLALVKILTEVFDLPNYVEKCEAYSIKMAHHKLKSVQESPVEADEFFEQIKVHCAQGEHFIVDKEKSLLHVRVGESIKTLKRYRHHPKEMNQMLKRHRAFKTDQARPYFGEKQQRAYTFDLNLIDVSFDKIEGPKRNPLAYN